MNDAEFTKYIIHLLTVSIPTITYNIASINYSLEVLQLMKSFSETSRSKLWKVKNQYSHFVQKIKFLETVSNQFFVGRDETLH